MKFWKMNGAGNDFLILNNLEEHLPLEQLPRIAKVLCERHLSIGADEMCIRDRLSPVIFSAQNHSTSELLRTLLMSGCF